MCGAIKARLHLHLHPCVHAWSKQNSVKKLLHSATSGKKLHVVRSARDSEETITTKNIFEEKLKQLIAADAFSVKL